MRILAILLLAVLVAAPALPGEIPVLPGDIFTPDPSLEAYRLELPTPQEEPEPEPKPPGLWWRLAGYGVYAACGTMAVSQQYRKERSYGASSPFVNNDVARVATIAGIAEGSNMGSEWFREKERTRLSLMTRIGTMAACTYVMADNFHKGWKRR